MAIRFQKLGDWVFDIRETFLSGYNQFYLGKSAFILTNTSEDWTLYYKVYFQNLSDTLLLVPDSTSPLTGSVEPGKASFRSFDTKYNSTTDPTGANPSYTITGEMVIEVYQDSGYTTLIDTITQSVEWKIINPNNMTLIKSWDFEDLSTDGLTNNGWSQWHIIDSNEAFSGTKMLREYFYHSDPWDSLLTHEVKTLISIDLSGYTEAYLIFARRKNYVNYSDATIINFEDFIQTDKRISLGNTLTTDGKWRKFVVPLNTSLTQVAVGFRAIVKYSHHFEALGTERVNGYISTEYNLDDIQIYGVA